MSFPVFDSALQVGAGRLNNVGEATVFYRDEIPVSSSVNDGSLAPGGSVEVAGSVWVVAARGERSAVTFAPAPPETAQGGGALEVAITGTPAVGETLHATAPDGVTLQWLRNGGALAGADAADYVVQSLDQGWPITCRASVASNALEIPPSPRPPLTEIVFVGDSFGAGGTPDLVAPFPVLVCDLLGVGLVNEAVGGAMQWFSGGTSIMDQIMGAVAATPAAAPYGPAFPAAVIQTSINNLNRAAVEADRAIITNALLCGLHRLRAGGRYPIEDTGLWFRTGAWTDQRATSEGASATLTTPEDFAGGTLRLYGVSIQGFGGTHTVTVDGVLAGTVDSTTATLVDLEAEPWELAIPDLTPGVHEIVVTMTDLVGLGAFFAGADFEAGTQLPFIVVVTASRAPAYPGGAHAITGDDVLEANAAVVAMLASEFPADVNIAVVDADGALGGGDPDFFSSDTIHANDAGAALLASPIADAITEGY